MTRARRVLLWVGTALALLAAAVVRLGWPFAVLRAMPYVNIRITRDGATSPQKAELIKGVTDLLVRVLNKDPAATFVIIDEVETDNWGLGGISVTEKRKGD